MRAHRSRQQRPRKRSGIHLSSDNGYEYASLLSLFRRRPVQPPLVTFRSFVVLSPVFCFCTLSARIARACTFSSARRPTTALSGDRHSYSPPPRRWSPPDILSVFVWGVCVRACVRVSPCTMTEDSGSSSWGTRAGTWRSPSVPCADPLFGLIIPPNMAATVIPRRPRRRHRTTT